MRRRSFVAFSLCLALAAVPGFGADKKKEGDKDRPVPPALTPHPVLWQEPKNIEQEDLYLGRGGSEHQPKKPFTFLSEAMGGTNPKFDVRDAVDTKWRVKLGVEAKPEVTASRLMWAVGYFTDEDYLLPTANVQGVHLKRGQELLHGDEVSEARFSRKPGKEKKIGIWRWKDNPFKGTREFNGLRVMMAVLNNWDLKDVNNAVYQDPKNNRQLFLVSDIGATFGANTEHRTHNTDKGNLQSYTDSKFITKKTDKDVSFGTPAFPGRFLFDEGPVLIPEAFRRLPLDWIGHDIPLQDARWIGGLLGRLSHEQIEDAFRAGGYLGGERESFVKLVEQRIAELKTL